MSRPTLTNIEINQFKRLLDTGLSRAQVAKKLGLSKSLVSRYTAGYKPKVSARSVLRDKTKSKYRQIAKMCKMKSMVEVAEATGDDYNTVAKACRMFPELCHKEGLAIALDKEFIADVKVSLRRGLDEYEIISHLHHKYNAIKKSDIQSVRDILHPPRLGFMGMMV